MFSRPDFGRAVADIQALLGDTDPHAGGLDQARLDEIRQAVTAGVRAPGRRRTWRPQRRHRRLLITSVALPVLLGATAAGWAVAASSPAIRVAGIVICFGSPKLHPPGTFVMTTQGQSAAVLCARVWTSSTAMNGHPYRHLPRLVTCVLPASRNPNSVGEGRVGVYAGTTCAALHLPPLPAGYDQAARQLAALGRYLQADSRAHCLSAPAAAAYARGALARFGFTGWVVTHPWGTGAPAGFAPQGCWEGQPDGAAHAIQVLPAPGHPAPTPTAALGPLRVMARLLPVTKAACRRGDAPQGTAATGRALRTALSRAGYGRWRVLVSRPTSAAQPCYLMEYYSLSRRTVYITSTFYLPPPTAARR